MSLTPKLSMPLLEEGVAQERLLHNQAISILDIVTASNVKSKDVLTPPGSPAEGDSYIIDGVGLSIWAGKDDNIAFFLNGIWNFIPPTIGMHFSMDDLTVDDKIEYDGTDWVPFSVATSSSFLLNPYTEAGKSQSRVDSSSVDFNGITEHTIVLPESSVDFLVTGTFTVSIIKTAVGGDNTSFQVFGAVLVDSVVAGIGEVNLLQPLNQLAKNGGTFEGILQNGDKVGAQCFFDMEISGSNSDTYSCTTTFDILTYQKLA